MPLISSLGNNHRETLQWDFTLFFISLPDPHGKNFFPSFCTTLFSPSCRTLLSSLPKKHLPASCHNAASQPNLQYGYPAEKATMQQGHQLDGWVLFYCYRYFDQDQIYLKWITILSVPGAVFSRNQHDARDNILLSLTRKTNKYLIPTDFRKSSKYGLNLRTLTSMNSHLNQMENV